MEYQSPRGTKDLLPAELPVWRDLEESARRIFSLYNYSEIRTPIFENIALFKRSLGSTTDIVKKQMFVFKQGSDNFVLRPEATAAIARAYIENSLGFGVKLRKLYYIGSMFRAERPQRGRLREFHHIGVEAIGSDSPFIDIEVMELADHLLRSFGINNYKFVVNSLGCEKDRLKFKRLLKQQLKPKKNELCGDCQKRMARNIFRVLDCKNEHCRKITANLSLNYAYLCPSCKEHFDKVLDGLRSLKINFVLSERLVRGLDYYSGVVFEVVHPDLGAQDALGAGGRYNNLFRELIAKPIGAVGFALGQERLLLVAAKKDRSVTVCAFFIGLGENGLRMAQELSFEMRNAGISADLDFSDASLKSKLKEANKLGAKFSIIIGDNEIQSGSVVVRDMSESKQETVSLGDLANFLRMKL